MQYFKFFEHHNDYDNYINDIKAITPNVSYCQDLNDTHYTKFEYKRLYLTITALEPGEFIFGYYEGTETEDNLNVSYSTDNGETWTYIENNGTEKTETIDVEGGDKILLKGDNVNLFSSGHHSSSIIIRSNFECEVSGNIMSLIYEDNFLNNIELPENNTFYQLFGKVESETENLGEYLINAKNLILPATTLVNNCYLYMFLNCTDLISAPELPATTLANSCYSNMFSGCTSLTTAPELPATTLANSCYLNMFNGCTSLTTAPELPANTLADNCYSDMFHGCTSLTTAPELPATTLANNCYLYMFWGCTSLTTAPELPATTLVNSCYSYMFRGCTSLTTAPELPATTLVEACYYSMFLNCTNLISAPELPATTLVKNCYGLMFYGCTSLTIAPELPATTLVEACYFSLFLGCTSLTTAPELPATTLVSNCYFLMFRGCTKLNYIKAMFTTTPSTTYTQNWVSGVASTGTFIKNSAASWTTTGVNGIPTGWTVQTASA